MALKRRTSARRVVSSESAKKTAPPKKSFLFVDGVQSLGRSSVPAVGLTSGASVRVGSTDVGVKC